MIDESDYDKKFDSLIKALRDARIQHEDAELEEKERKLQEWESLKHEFNELVIAHRQNRTAHP
ncbi:MAG TPA: hypothetical protein VK974_01285 [Methylophilaceae bacterium]|nr:hypothetical protein [Methylophilaceae bacterium]